VLIRPQKIIFAKNNTSKIAEFYAYFKTVEKVEKNLGIKIY
jgi:hypothetical protein